MRAHDPILVAVVEELGAESAKSENLQVVTLRGRRYMIEDYDGFEAVIDPENPEGWIVVP